MDINICCDKLNMTDDNNTKVAAVQHRMKKEDMEFKSWEDSDKVPLKHELLRGIYSYGFENPSPIQKKAIIPLINRHDVIAQAQSGTGKTGAFVIGSLQLINEELHATHRLLYWHIRENWHDKYLR